MKLIFQEVYRVLANHRVCVVNVGDVTGQLGEAKYTVTKIALSTYFIKMMIEIGFEFVDDYIWDKGETQSKRFMHGIHRPYPLMPLPINAYEHILIFHKHEENKTRIPCPICKKTKIHSNGFLSEGVQSWECKNPTCTQKSKAGRGKRFSELGLMRACLKSERNKIPDRLLQLWRRDIVKISPVIKIKSDGTNKIGHTAPFPREIPEMAILFYTGKGENVLDPFGGIFTTSEVAKLNKRNSVSIEINKDFAKKGVKRLNIHQKTVNKQQFKYIRKTEKKLIERDERLKIPKSPFWNLDDYISNPEKFAFLKDHADLE
jgi:DNA modification methylase